MIEFFLSDKSFEYDVYSLVKAFFPEEEVQRIDEAEDASGSVSGSIRFSLFYREEEITCETVRVLDDRPATKNRLKLDIYGLLCKIRGRSLPWGTLTGIRPTKIATGILENGGTPEDIRTYMSRTYSTSNEKIDLAIRVAQTEQALFSRIRAEDGYSLYIGIPFCPTTCLYCSFTSYALGLWKNRVDEYLDAVLRELSFVAESMRGRMLQTIYIGGGTPTSLTARQFNRLFTFIEEHFDLSRLLEYTVEAGRPDSITQEKLSVLRAHGIGRISINPQTMNQKTLDLIGRRHTVEQTAESFAMARAAGFATINADLIAGLPQESTADICHTMERMKELAPENLTIHALARKRAARLTTHREEYETLSMVYTDQTVHMLENACREMGLSPYYLYRQKNMAGNFENVGYAVPGHEGLYNILIMEEKQTIMAVGAGAVTKFVLTPEQARTRARKRSANDSDYAYIFRVQNVKDIEHYLRRTDEMIERKRREMEELLWL